MRKSILVVEDDQYILESIKSLFEMENFDVTTTRNGQEAIDYLTSATKLPQVILLDLMMPVKDGFEFRNEQVKNPRLASIPTVILTAEGNASKRKDRLNAQAIVRKPVDIDELVRIVNQYCFVA